MPLKKLMLTAVAVMSLGAATAHAAPTIVDFEDIPEGTESASATSRGFHFAGDGAGFLFYTNGAGCGPACASNGTRTLLAGGLIFADSSQVTLTRNGGGTFVLTSLDAGEMFSGGFPQYAAARIDYSEFLGGLGGLLVASGSIVLDGINDGPGGVPDFQSFSVPGALVDTIRFVGAGGTNGNNGFNLDNLTIQDATAIPEPSSLLLVGLGLAGLIGACRRRAA